MRRIASPKSGATETTSIFGENTTGCVSIESVTRRRWIGLCVEPLHRALAEDAVGHRGIHGLCTALDECVRRVGQGPAEIVKSSTIRGGLALHLPNNLQDLGALIVGLALFVRDGDGGAQEMRHTCAHASQSPCQGRPRRDPVAVCEQSPHTGPARNIGRRPGCGKSPGSGGVQVKRHHTVGAGRLNGISADTGPDGDPGFVLFVAFRITEIRHDDRH